MAGLQITITDAGRAALPNGPNTGTSAVTISHVGVSPVHTAGSLKGLTALPGEVKRVTTFGGDIVADDVIHVTINDETTAVYSVRSFGLYLSTGVLFAVFSAPDVVVEKSAGAMVLLSADITFKTLDTAVIQFGGTGFINPPATTERVGVVELATWEEAAAGARADVVVTPFGLLKTFQSWATNFAAAIHRHAMSSIDGLPEALAGKSATGHKHDAGDTTSGVFDVGRIPALAMEKITGLAMALALRASLGANANFADVRVTRGGRVGVLYFGDGDEFILLSGGDLATNRPFNSPALSSGGNPVWHSGNFNPATKADLGANVGFALVRVGAGRALLYSDANTNNLLVRTGAEGQEKFFQHGDDGSFRALSGNVHSQHGRVWDPGNFDPNTKATVNDPILYGSLHFLSANARARLIGDGDTLFLQAYSATSNAGNLVLSGGFGQNLTSLRVQMGGGLRDIFHTGNFDPNLKANAATPSFTGTSYFGTEKRGQIWMMGGDDRPGVIEFRVDGVRYGFIGYGDGPNGNMYFGTDDNRSWIFTKRPSFNGATPWDTANFNPAGKVNTVNPDNFPHLVNFGWNGDRFVANVDNAVSHALLHMGDATSSLGSSGYAKIPGTGLMIQWGVSTSNIPEGQAHAYLPIAFGGGCLIALANPRNPGSNVNSDYYMQVVSKHLDRIVFYANRANGSSGNVDGFDWIAIGRVSGTPDPAYGSGGGGIGGGGGQVDPYV
ncbi:hypothetical protein ABIC32_002441 [Brevundimonas sp. 1080]|uniref:gp53-like domain-containing protein n=1 Tax=Brevundimonas sp. 1080 TaxID=3156405 RepID=UPI003397B4CD